MSNDTMVHAHLMKKGTHYHCWLPKRFAVLGKKLDIQGVGEGWQVMHIWTNLPTATVIERSQDYRKQREASDI